MRAAAKIAVAALSLSAAGLGWLVANEGGQHLQAYRPTPKDVPTICLGSTRHIDGSRVKMGDALSKEQCDALDRSNIARFEASVRKCTKAPISQVEYDTLVDFAFNVGVSGYCKSTMVRLINARHYIDACYQYRRWRYHAGFDCSTPGNRICAGIWTRRLQAEAKCLHANGIVGL